MLLESELAALPSFTCPARAFGFGLAAAAWDLFCRFIRVVWGLCDPFFQLCQRSLRITVSDRQSPSAVGLAATRVHFWIVVAASDLPRSSGRLKSEFVRQLGGWVVIPKSNDIRSCSPRVAVLGALRTCSSN